jgi:hypothetical protein
MPVHLVESQNINALGGYTKNISELVFSPSLNTRPKSSSAYRTPVKATLKPAAPIDLNSTPPKSQVSKKSGSRYSKTDVKHVKSIKVELSNEKERRLRLEKSVKEIRDQMSTIAQSVKSLVK